MSDDGVLVRGGDRPRFLHRHILIMAFHTPLTGLGAEHLGATDLTAIAFAQLVSQGFGLLEKSSLLLGLGLFQGQGLPVALDGAIPTPGHDELRATHRTHVPFPDLIRHKPVSPSKQHSLAC